MTKVTAKALPHAVGSAEILNAELKRVVTYLMENDRSLHEQLAEAQKAIIELQRRA